MVIGTVVLSTIGKLAGTIANPISRVSARIAEDGSNHHRRRLGGIVKGDESIASKIARGLETIFEGIHSVRNISGTSNNKLPCSCDSWIDFYEKSTGRKVYKCACCNFPAEVGAHVQKVDGLDKAQYIIPLCYSCNAKPAMEGFSVRGKLVPVQV